MCGTGEKEWIHGGERESVPSLTGGSQSVTDFTGQRANEKLVGCEVRGQNYAARSPPFATL